MDRLLLMQSIFAKKSVFLNEDCMLGEYSDKFNSVLDDFIRVLYQLDELSKDFPKIDLKYLQALQSEGTHLFLVLNKTINAVYCFADKMDMRQSKFGPVKLHDN